MASSTQHPNVFERLRWAVDDVLDHKLLREKQYRSFRQGLQFKEIKLNDFEAVVPWLPSAGTGGFNMQTAAELYRVLSDFEKAQLREHYLAKLRVIEKEFRDLK